MIELSDYNTHTFLPAIERLITDPSAELVTTSSRILRLFTSKQIDTYFDKHLQDSRPRFSTFLAQLLSALTGKDSSIAAVTLKHIGNQTAHAMDKRKLDSLLYHLVLKRPQISLKDVEILHIRAMANLLVNKAISNDAWHTFAARTVVGDGKYLLVLPPPRLQDSVLFPMVHRRFRDYLTDSLSDHTAFIASTAANLARFNAPSPSPGQGPRWMTPADRPSIASLSFNPNPDALILGYDASTQKPMTFTGNESLITIGPPGSGKTECQVIPNLLTYPGSAIILDVKGELWERTAGARARFGPIFRFAPTDRSGNTHCYNPFDFISRDPHQAAADCTSLAAQLLPPAPEAREPFWIDRARDYIRAMALLVAITASPQKRHLGNVLRCLSFPTDLKPTSDKFPGSFTDILTSAMLESADKHRLPALKSIPTDILGGLGGTTLPSILEHARQALAIFNASNLILSAVARSDWHPNILRTQPGTSLYLCLSGNDLEAYAPIIRIILAQHAAALLSNFTNISSGRPITFFLDEFPQIGPSITIRRMLETGRGAGLRLWLFAQTLSQINAAYGQSIGSAIPNMCAIQTYMRCDPESAAHLQPYLGNKRHVLTGDAEPLATIQQLTVGQYADKIIAITRNPYVLEKRYAFATLRHLQRPAPVLTRPATVTRRQSAPGLTAPLKAPS